MIIELLVSAVASVVRALGGLFPTSSATIPTATITSAASEVGSSMAVFGAWVPVTDVLLAFGLIVATLAVGFVIKLVRIVASFLTAGGGSAA